MPPARRSNQRMSTVIVAKHYRLPALTLPPEGNLARGRGLRENLRQTVAV